MAAEGSPNRHPRWIFREGISRFFLPVLLAGCLACVALQSCTPSQQKSSTKAASVSEEPVSPHGISAIDAAEIDVDYPVNEYGETYGDVDDVPEGSWRNYEELIGMHPDLIRVRATNDAVGYVRKEEFLSPPPESSGSIVWVQVEQAMKRAEKTMNGAPSLTVYDADGRTVLGEFTIG